MNQTILKEYNLWYDGSITVDSSKLMSFLQKHPTVTSNLFVTEMTQTIDKYNKFVSVNERITVKTNCNPLSFEWNIPDKYKHLNLSKYFHDRLLQIKQIDSLTDEEYSIRKERVDLELQLFNKNNLEQMLQTIIFIINTLETNNIVWGVGRGSSVSSYLLYLANVHDVDSVLYELDIQDFIN